MDSNVNESLYRKKLIKSKSGLRIVLVNEKYRSPFLLGEPNWVPDNQVRSFIILKIKNLSNQLGWHFFVLIINNNLNK